MANKKKHAERSKRSYRKDLQGYQDFIRKGFFYQKKRNGIGIMN